MGGLVSYFAQTEANIKLTDAYWYATGIVVSTAIIAVGFHPAILYIYKMSCRLRVACGGLIYQKSLRLRKSATEEGQNGKIVNILSSDLAKLDIGFLFVYFLWKGPLEAIAFFIVIYLEIGLAAIAGMICLACFVPVQGISHFGILSLPLLIAF